MQTITSSAFAPRPPAPSTKDSAGMTLTAARAAALRGTLPTGAVLVVGRLYPHGMLSTTWTWAARGQIEGRAPHRETLEGGAIFHGVEVVVGPARVRIPW